MKSKVESRRGRHTSFTFCLHVFNQVQTYMTKVGGGTNKRKKKKKMERPKSPKISLLFK